MKTKKTYAIAASFMIALLGMSLVMAYQGNPAVQGPDYSEERHEAMEQAFDNSDYNAWVSLMQETGRNPRVLDVVTEDNFATFVGAHEAAQNGDLERARELRGELGLNDGQGPKDGSGHRGMMNKGSGQGQGQMKAQGNYGNCPYAN